MILEYLDAREWDNEPHVSLIEIKHTTCAVFTVNGHPLLYDVQDIVWNGMDKLAERDNWRQY